jgi:ABC-type microcin C transport system duplicated ATPase subunit YejF
VAVALANHPALLLADEPTGALDRSSAAQVMQLIAGLRQRYDLTVLIATHDLEVAAFADRILTLRDGALGQDLSHAVEDRPAVDDSGRIRLPSEARTHLADAARIAVEIRPEGILLRPENDALDDAQTLLRDMLPQDAPPVRRRWWRRLFRRRGKK